MAYQIRVWFILLARTVFSVSLMFAVYAMFCFLVFGCSTIAINSLERLVSEMTYYVSSGTLNRTRSLT